MNMPKVTYFLGANSPDGFYSLYSELIPVEQASHIYIIKGGAGCGKSTLMRQVASQLESQGETVEYICCSGDPDSLDAVVFPNLGAAMVDGTAPHVVEPKYPGLIEEYVNLGKTYNQEGLQTIRETILSCMQGYQEHYQRAYRCLNAAAEILMDMRSMVLTTELKQKLQKRGKGIGAKELKDKKTGETGTVRQRFLDAITHKGSIVCWDTVYAQCPRIYELVDGYGLAHEVLSELLADGLKKGYSMVACPDPMFPEQVKHLLIPELGLAFVTTQNKGEDGLESYRTIYLDHMIDAELLAQNKARLKFARKVSGALVEEAVVSLVQAKEMHDGLEKNYNPFVDFSMVSTVADRIVGELLHQEAKN